MKLPDPALQWPLPWPAVVAIAGYEGCRLNAYKNFRNEPWTCGWGETDGVGPTTQWTQEYADQRFCDSLGERVDAVLAVCKIRPTVSQLGALVSLAYNIGMSAFKRSTVLRCHNAGDFAGAARAFKLWNQVDGAPNEALTARRLKESAMYSTPEPGAESEPMPQAVDPETPLHKSPINAGAAAAATIGFGELLTQASHSIEALKPVVSGARAIIVDTLGVPLQWLVPALLIGAGVLVVTHRWRQRNGGWA